MTEQEQRQFTFDRAAEHLLRQGVKSETMNADGGEVCVYRQNREASCPTRCVVGALIRDDKYTSKMEGLGASDLVEQYADQAVFIPGVIDDRSFLGDLQYIHDSRTPADWPQLLARFATERGLTFGEQPG